MLPLIAETISSYENIANNLNINSDRLSGTGNRFVSEFEMVESFADLFHSSEAENNYNIYREFECSNGIADIIIFELRQDWKSSLCLGNIPPRWAYAYRSLPYRKIFTTEDFMALTGISQQRARQALNEFVSLGLCENREKAKSWYKLIQPRPLVNHIHAIEAKLKNWKRALEQATRYQDYAEQAWVLLDEKSITPALNNIEHFKHFDIGLSTISRDGVLSSFHTPTIRKPKSEIYFWQANSLIAQYLQNKNHLR